MTRGRDDGAQRGIGTVSLPSRSSAATNCSAGIRAPRTGDGAESHLSPARANVFNRVHPHSDLLQYNTVFSIAYMKRLNVFGCSAGNSAPRCRPLFSNHRREGSDDRFRSNQMEKVMTMQSSNTQTQLNDSELNAV